MKTMRFLLVLILMTAGCQKQMSEKPDYSLLPVSTGQNFQFIDQEGKIIINPQFVEESIFRDDIALIATESKGKRQFGFIDKSGKYIIDPIYKNATTFFNGIAFCVMDNSFPVAIDRSGTTLFELKDIIEVRGYCDGLAAVCSGNEKGKLWGFLDTKGKVVITPQYKSTGGFSEGLCRVQDDDGKWGYIDNKGRVIINFQFDEAMTFHNGFAIVSSGGKFGIIDGKGKFVVSPQFEMLFYDHPYFIIKQNDKLGWCDKHGKIVINPQFDDANPFNGNDLAPVMLDDKWGFIDIDGEMVINYQFDYANCFTDGLALVLMGDKIGFINQDGKYEINPQYDSVSQDYIYKSRYNYDYYFGVESDHYDIDKLVLEFIKEFHDNNMSRKFFNQDIITIANNFNVDTSNLEHSDQIKLVTGKQIVDGAKYDLKIVGNDIWEFKISGGWLSGFNYAWKIKQSVKPKHVIYNIVLSGRTVDRVKEIYEKMSAAINKSKSNGTIESELIFSYNIREIDQENSPATVDTTAVPAPELNTPALTLNDNDYSQDIFLFKESLLTVKVSIK